MPTSSQSVQHDPLVTPEKKYAVYDPVESLICHHNDGAAISDTQDKAVDDVSVVADHMGLSADRLVVVQLTITPAENSPADGFDDDSQHLDKDGQHVDEDTQHVGDESHDADADLTTGSITVTRGPHRRNSTLVEYREAEDGAWAVKTPEDDEFWIFIRSGTERDVHQHIRAKWDAVYSNPAPFTDQSCPTRDL